MKLRDDLSAGVNVTLHFVFLGTLAWSSGQPFPFSSPGPSAYLLAPGDSPRAEGVYYVIGGHAIAAVVGLTTYLLFADGLMSTPLDVANHRSRDDRYIIVKIKTAIREPKARSIAVSMYLIGFLPYTHRTTQVMV